MGHRAYLYIFAAWALSLIVAGVHAGPSPKVENDVYAHHGRQIITRYISRLTDPTRVPGPVSDPPPPGFNQRFRAAMNQSLPADPVGILGAGAAGLYTALIFEDLGIPYHIVEAQDRVGGRLFTHYFEDQTGAPFNYFDIGAMRFPQIDAMRRVWHLFNYSALNTGNIQLSQRLQPYIFSNNNTFLSYNGVTVRASQSPTDETFRAKSVIKDVSDPSPYTKVGWSRIVRDVLRPFVEALYNDIENGTTTGWEYMQKYDKYSTRAYMATEYRPSKELQAEGLPDAPLSNDVINWCETRDKSTGWYDRAFAETVLEEVAFGWQPDGTRAPFKCVAGGASQIAQSMYQYILGKHPDAVTLNKRVTGISLAKDSMGNKVMHVKTDDSQTQQYSHVVSTIPLPVLRMLDIDNAGLSIMQQNALRQLDYGPSVKIGMLFKSAWWTTAKNLNGEPLNIIGGQSFTDRPLRTIVYPSFGDVQNAKTTSLIASYSWTFDSDRMGAFLNNGLEVVENYVLKELALIHNVSYDFLSNDLIRPIKPWDWGRDRNTLGAFAFFGPGKFENLYTSLNTYAADGHLHFASEALSTRHAWVEGALDSAWRAVAELLTQPGFQQYQTQFYKNWGTNPEWFTKEGAHVLLASDADVDEALKGSLLFAHLAATHPLD